VHPQEFDDSMSGTTAIGAFFKGTQFTVANIGDSRAVVGEKKGKRVIAYSLSIDQTPYRADERERVKASGAVVMSCDQLEGIVP
jgi:serine/threonine protein phosphatase PrpC